MKPLLLSKPFMGLVLLLLIVQMACAASSISPTSTGPAAGTSSSGSTQGAATQPSTGSQATQPVPSTGGQATQVVPSTGGQATQAMPPTSASGNSSSVTPQAMLQQVVQHYQTAGRAQALQDFTNQNPPFNAPGMFVMCLGSDHKITAMGGFPLLVGVSADSLSAVTGQSIGALIWDAATVQPQGNLSFQWKNPLSGQTESKTIYYQKLSQDICGVVDKQP